MVASTSFDSSSLAVVEKVAKEVVVSLEGSSSDVVERSCAVVRYIVESSSPGYFRRRRVNMLPCVGCGRQLELEDLEGEVLFVVDSTNITRLVLDQSRLFGTMKEYCLSSLCVRCQTTSTSFDSVILRILKDVATEVQLSVEDSRWDVLERSRTLYWYIVESSLKSRRVNLLPCAFCSGQLNLEDLRFEVLFVVDSKNATQLVTDQRRLFDTMKEYCVSCLCVRCQSGMFSG